MALIEIKDLNYSYGENQVLNDVSFTVSANEFIGIIGPNGAGKSTLLKLLDGIFPDRGDHIFLNGSPLGSIPRRNLARIIAYLPQETEMAFDFSVREVVRMGRFPYLQGIQIYTAWDETVVTDCMHLLDIHKFRDRSFRELSGGEKQRVLIASALAQEPAILLLDEPTSALDLHHQIEIYQILKGLQQDRDITVIVVTHDINLAAQFCERMILMDLGRIVRDGPPDQVLQFKILQEIFGVKVYIDINPMTDSLYILPYQ